MLRAIRGNKKRETTEISFNDSVKTEPTGQNLNSCLTRKRQAIAIGSGPDWNTRHRRYKYKNNNDS